MNAATLVAELAPIGLDELDERAALQTRVDRKYMLPASALPAVLADLPGSTRVLAFGERGAADAAARAAAYESVYFDTPQLTAFHLAAHSRRRRFKVRTRSYLDSAQTFLEVKTRGGRSATVKDRLEYDPADHDALTADGCRYARTVLDAAGIPMPQTLAPTLVTRYRRTTLLLPGGRGESRATIDVDLEWVAATGTDAAPLRTPGAVIVETKSGSSAGALDRALWRHGHRPATLSKFGTGLAALHPDLPSNKWARVLRRHFPPTTA